MEIFVTQVHVPDLSMKKLCSDKLSNMPKGTALMSDRGLAPRAQLPASVFLIPSSFSLAPPTGAFPVGGGRASPPPPWSSPVPGTGQPHVQVLSCQHPVIHSSLGAQPPFRLSAGRAEGGMNPSPTLGQAIPDLPALSPPSQTAALRLEMWM